MSYRKVQGGSSLQLAEAVIININGIGHSSCSHASYLLLNELYMYSLKFPKYYGNMNIASVCTLLAHSVS